MSQRCPVGLGSVQAWYQFLPPPRTFCTLSLHEAGCYRAPGGTQDPLHQRSLTVFPRVSSWYLMAVSAIASRSVHPSLFVSPWPTMKAVMLNDVTGSRMLSTSSPDPLMSVTCTRGWTCPFSRVPGKAQVEHAGPSCHPHELSDTDFSQMRTSGKEMSDHPSCLGALSHCCLTSAPYVNYINNSSWNWLTNSSSTLTRLISQKITWLDEKGSLVNFFGDFVLSIMMIKPLCWFSVSLLKCKERNDNILKWTFFF